MTKFNSLLSGEISDGKYDCLLSDVYHDTDLNSVKNRYIKLLDDHRRTFGDQDVLIVSAPGRTELGGNHTDHNLGIVLAAGVTLDTLAVVSASEERMIHFHSEGYDPVIMDSSDSTFREEEKETTISLLRGILFRFEQLNYRTGGFSCYVNSEVAQGSGLSSSASVEVLIGSILNELYNGGKISPVEIAKAGQYAENNFFGKASGLMDQVACACAGIVGIDFYGHDAPLIRQCSYDFRRHGYVLTAVDSRSSHAELADEYSAIPNEMRLVAGYFGKQNCREIDRDQLILAIPEIRKLHGDRAVLRTLHFLGETDRAAAMFTVLQDNNIEEYFRLAEASGNSSFKYLQNIYQGLHPQNQAVSLALKLTEDFLEGQGACRIQGGGFAGSIQAFIPADRLDSYRSLMESVFGTGAVTELSVRQLKAGKIL